MEDATHFSYYKKMTKTKIDLAFKGPFSHEILLSLADTLLETISQENDLPKNSKKVFAIFVELTQNMRDYSAEKKTFQGKSVGTGLVTMREDDSMFLVTSGNLVEHEKAKMVVDYCNHLNSLDKVGLKKLYKEKINMPADDQTNGGVGLITIALKTNSPLVTVVEPVDDKYSFFVLSVEVLKEQTNG
jgi:hypothetical protein